MLKMFFISSIIILSFPTHANWLKQLSVVTTSDAETLNEKLCIRDLQRPKCKDNPSLCEVCSEPMDPDQLNDLKVLEHFLVNGLIRLRTLPNPFNPVILLNDRKQAGCENYQRKMNAIVEEISPQTINALIQQMKILPHTSKDPKPTYGSPISKLYSLTESYPIKIEDLGEMAHQLRSSQTINQGNNLAPLTQNVIQTNLEQGFNLSKLFESFCMNLDSTSATNSSNPGTTQ